MQHVHFPLYRRSVNGLNWYRIESPVELTEVQRVGERYIVHRIKAELYPEKARIMALMAMDEGHAEACDAEEVERLLQANG
jgi:hypothetical protein